MAFPLLSRRLPHALFGACVVAGVALILLANGPSQAASPSQAQSATIVQLRIDGEIEPILAEYIVDGIHEAAPRARQPDSDHDQYAGRARHVHALDHSGDSAVAGAGGDLRLSHRLARRLGRIFHSALRRRRRDVARNGYGRGLADHGDWRAARAISTRLCDKKILNEATAYLRSYVSKRGRNADLAATAVTDAKAFSEKEALDGKLVDLEANVDPAICSPSSTAGRSRASTARRCSSRSHIR